MAAVPSAGAETSNPQGTSIVQIDNLVPLDTQLMTPTLAEAFELPYLGASSGDFPTVSQAQQGQAPQSLPQTAALKQPTDYTFQRNMYGGAQQPLMGNFFPQQNAAALGPQGVFPLDAQDHQAQNMFRQPPGLAAHQGPQGFGNMSPQFNQWLDVNVPGPFANAQNPLKHSHDGNVGSDPDNDDYQARALKRPRLVWTMQLHQRFVEAVEQLGLKNAVPKTIMQLMNIDGLTRENVASHLQKYRMQLKKDTGKGDDGDKLVEEDTPKDTEADKKPNPGVSESLHN